jgi:hypothetical protein
MSKNKPKAQYFSGYSQIFDLKEARWRFKKGITAKEAVFQEPLNHAYGDPPTHSAYLP